MLPILNCTFFGEFTPLWLSLFLLPIRCNKFEAIDLLLVYMALAVNFIIRILQKKIILYCRLVHLGLGRAKAQPRPDFG